MTPEFKKAVQTYGPRFMTDLGLTRLHVGGIFGNLAVESGQFTQLQEINPTVKGSRGGWGWPQWTGPRRRQFEAWAKANRLKLDDPEGFYRYIVLELQGSEKAALARLKRTKTLDTATTAFMLGYERPGIPHEEKRKKYALEALQVLDEKIGLKGGLPGDMTPNYEATTPEVTPHVETVAPSGKRPGLLGWLFGKKIGVPEVAGTKNDPTIYYVQTMMKQRAYYTKGLPDGLDGPMTQEAVAQIRKDNGMGDGGIDPEFLAKLPAFPQRPVSEARSRMSVVAAAQHAPELFKPATWLGGLGVGSVGLGGLSSLVDQGKDVADKANDLLAQGQTVAGYATWAFNFLAEHKTLILLALGAFLVFRALSWMLDAWIKVRQAFF